MADTTALKNRIRAAIKTNDNQEITGPVLQQTLLDIVDELDLNPELSNEIQRAQGVEQNLQQAINILAEAGILIGEKANYGYGGEQAYEGTYITKDGVITIKDSAVSEDCLLLSLKTRVKIPGKFKIGIGHMDQRSWYLEVASFDVETQETGVITWGLADRQIIIPKDEQIFIYSNHYSDEAIGFESGQHDQGFYFGSASGALEYFPDGGFCTVYYETRVVKTSFASKEELNKTDENVFDVSLNLPTSGESGGNTYTLQSAINAVPVRKQRGGLVLKFIDSVSEQYVKYQLVNKNWSTDIVNDWKQYDFEAKDGNLGIKTHLTISDSDIYGKERCPYDGILRSNNTVENLSGTARVSGLVEINKRYIYCYSIWPKTGTDKNHRTGLLLFNANKEIIADVGDNTNIFSEQTNFIDVETDYPTAKYARFCVYNHIYSYVCFTDDVNYPLKHEAHLLSSHVFSFGGCKHNTVYQNDKIGLVECHLSKEYEGYSFLIYQFGWLESKKAFLFAGALASPDGVNVTKVTAYDILDHNANTTPYASIPLEDKLYFYKLKIGGNTVGTIRFKYLWSKIGGNTGNRILDLDTVGQGFSGSITVNPVFYDYEEVLTNNILAEAGILIGEKANYGYGGEQAYEGTYITKDGVITIKDSAVSEDCLLLSLKTRVKIPGKFKIGIGHMDQRSWYLEVASFDVETQETGVITWGLADRQIIIPKDEQIFIYSNHYSDEAIGFESGQHDQGFYFGSASGALEYFPDGGFCTVYYETRVVKTSFASKEELNKTDENVSTISNIANTALSNNFKAKDRAGNLYKLVVVNGTLQIVPMQFSNVLVIGNSICEHPQIQDYGGWHASGRGMASSVVGNDYCGILQTALRRTIPAALVTRYNQLAPWFRNPTDLSDAKFAELFGNILSNNYDLVVFRLSENNNDHIDLMKNAIVACINYIWRQLPKAEVIITSDVMDFNSAKNAQLSAAALELSVTYVEANCAHSYHKYDDINWNYVPYFYKGGDNVLYPIQKAFHTHPNDLGMLKVANSILAGLGYASIELSHSIIINSQQDYNAWSEGVENGIITVLLYGESAPSAYTVVNANGNNIQATLHDMSNVVYHTAPSRVPTYAITFVMPNSNVTVNIS